MSGQSRSTAEILFELKGLKEAMDDPEFDRVVEIIAQCIAQPSVPPSKIADIITELTALAAKMGLKKTWFKTFGKTDGNATLNRQKKDVYFTVQDAIYQMVDALKYHTRTKEFR